MPEGQKILNKRSRSGPRITPKVQSIIILLIVMGLTLFFFSTGQSAQPLMQSSWQITTGTATPTATNVAQTQPTEPDITNGLILAGALLILVILLGTLHATWGRRKQPLRS